MGFTTNTVKYTFYSFYVLAFLTAMTEIHRMSLLGETLITM